MLVRWPENGRNQCTYCIQNSHTNQLLLLQKIKDLIYAHFKVTKDPASQSDIDGEDKLKLKGMYVQCLIVVGISICAYYYQFQQAKKLLIDRYIYTRGETMWVNAILHIVFGRVKYIA